MKIPDDAIIPTEKLTNYLLVHRSRNDKSKYLASAGFDASCPDLLLDELRRLVTNSEAVEDRVDDYGTSYVVRGQLTGPNGRTLNVITVWILRRSNNSISFVTLKPDRSRTP